MKTSYKIFISRMESHADFGMTLIYFTSMLIRVYISVHLTGENLFLSLSLKMVVKASTLRKKPYCMVTDRKEF